MNNQPNSQQNITLYRESIGFEGKILLKISVFVSTFINNYIYRLNKRDKMVCCKILVWDQAYWTSLHFAVAVGHLMIYQYHSRLDSGMKHFTVSMTSGIKYINTSEYPNNSFNFKRNKLHFMKYCIKLTNNYIHFNEYIYFFVKVFKYILLYFRF